MVLKDLGFEDGVKLEDLRREWCKLFDEPMSLHTYPAEIKKRELLITVDSPVWLQQLGFFKQEILKKLEAYDVRSVKFRHGRIYRKRVSATGAAIDSDLKARAKAKRLSDSEIAWIEDTVSTLSDPELRETIRKTLEKSLKK